MCKVCPRPKREKKKKKRKKEENNAPTIKTLKRTSKAKATEGLGNNINSGAAALFAAVNSTSHLFHSFQLKSEHSGKEAVLR